MAADDAGLTGLLIASRYRIGSRIGAGGMGIVHAAIDEQLRRQVAVKFLPSASQPDDDRLGRFRNEALDAYPLSIIPTSSPSSRSARRENHAVSSRWSLSRARPPARGCAQAPCRLRDAVDTALQVARALRVPAHAKGHRSSRHQARERDRFAATVTSKCSILAWPSCAHGSMQRNPC